MNRELKINVFVPCFNEAYLAKWAIDYWKRYANHVYIYDNGSTDGCLDIFKEYPDFISIGNFETNNQIDDLKLIYLKNNIWKDFRDCDFVVVSDLDEFLYADNLMEELQYMKNNEMTICCPRFGTLVSLKEPEYEAGKLIHIDENVKFLELPIDRRTSSHKVVLFNPQKITEINYEVGAHKCNPKGDVKFYDKDNIFVLHATSIGFEHILKKNKIYKTRLSENNKQNGWGVHYNDGNDAVCKTIIQMYKEGRNLL